MTFTPVLDVDRIRGSLLAAACGDALGVPFVGRDHVRAELVESWSIDRAPLRPTRGTVMAIAVAEDLAEHLAEYPAEPAVGRRSLNGARLRKALCGVEPDEAGRARNPGVPAAVLSHPVGLLPLPLGDIAVLARQVAVLSGAGPPAAGGAVVQACAVALAAHSDPVDRLRPLEFLRDLHAHLDAGPLSARLCRIAALHPATGPHRIAGTIGGSASAVTCVPAGLAAFFRHPGSPQAALMYAVQIGGHTAAIAALSGAVAGARCGTGDLPFSWMRRLTERRRLLRLADSLAALQRRVNSRQCH